MERNEIKERILLSLNKGGSEELHSLVIHNEQNCVANLMNEGFKPIIVGEMRENLQGEFMEAIKIAEFTPNLTHSVDTLESIEGFNQRMNEVRLGLINQNK